MLGKQDTNLYFVTNTPDKHTGPFSLLGHLVTLIPRIAYSDSQPRPVRVERDGGDGRVVLGILAQALLRLVIPDGDVPI